MGFPLDKPNPYSLYRWVPTVQVLEIFGETKYWNIGPCLNTGKIQVDEEGCQQGIIYPTVNQGLGPQLKQPW